MRSLAILVVAVCGACIPVARDEFIPVRVPVCTEQPSVVGMMSTQTMPVAVSAPPTTSTSDPCDAAPSSISLCSGIAHVRVGDILTQPHCYLDTKVRSGEVGRLMQCPSGVVVVFENAIFAGDVADGYINTCKSTTYDFPERENGGDDCTWRTEQRIVGSINDGLSFSYTEGPVAGASCSLACRAHSTLEVIR